MLDQIPITINVPKQFFEWVAKDLSVAIESRGFTVSEAEILKREDFHKSVVKFIEQRVVSVDGLEWYLFRHEQFTTVFSAELNAAKEAAKALLELNRPKMLQVSKAEFDAAVQALYQAGIKVM